MYDAFGNISKTGNPGGSFLPTYSPATNQFTLTGANVAYDANGNLLTDNLYSYTWDPNFGNPSSVTNQMGGNDSVYGLVYDALGRMVEQDDSFRECAIHICITSTPSQGQIVIRPRRAEAGIGERTESSEGVHSTARWRGSDLRLVGP
jgi:YD repeat-containing protein